MKQHFDTCFKRYMVPGTSSYPGKNVIGKIV